MGGIQLVVRRTNGITTLLWAWLGSPVTVVASVSHGVQDSALYQNALTLTGATEHHSTLYRSQSQSQSDCLLIYSAMIHRQNSQRLATLLCR